MLRHRCPWCSKVSGGASLRPSVGKKYIITLLLRRLLSYYDWDDDDYYYQGVGGHEDLGVGIHGVQGLGASGGLRVFSI